MAQVVLSACLTSALHWASQDKPVYQFLSLPLPLPLPSPSSLCSIFFPGKSSLTTPLQPRLDRVVPFYFPLHSVLPAPYHRLVMGLRDYFNNAYFRLAFHKPF